MRRIKVAIFAFGLLITFLTVPNLAIAGDLSAWGSYFTQDYSKVNAYHFALLRDVNTGQVFHVAEGEVFYSFDPQDSLIQSYVGTAAVSTAQGIWGGWMKFTRSSVAGSHVVLRYGGVNIQNPNWGAAVYHPAYPSDTNADGTAKKGGYIGMDFFYYGVHNRSSSHIGHSLAHELGHVVGLHDVYGLGVDTSDSIMGDGTHTLNSLGRPDLNGLHILQHNPWYQENNGQWKYWDTPGTFKTSWQWLKDGNGLNYWFFFLSGGTMSTNNWHTDSTSRAYVGANGRAYSSSWQTIGGYWYCFDDSAHPYTNTWRPDSYSRGYVGQDGRAVTGWKKLKDTNGIYYWFYLDPASASMLKNQWQPDSTSRGYVGSDGRAVTGWQKLKDTNGTYYWFYLDPASASMLKNQWQPDSYSRGYVGSDGRAVTGWQWLKDTNGTYYWFYLDLSLASMYKNRTQDDSGGTCYLKDNGRAARNEWVIIGNNRCEVDAYYHLTGMVRAL